MSRLDSQASQATRPTGHKKHSEKKHSKLLKRTLFRLKNIRATERLLAKQPALQLGLHGQTTVRHDKHATPAFTTHTKLSLYLPVPYPLLSSGFLTPYPYSL